MKLRTLGSRIRTLEGRMPSVTSTRAQTVRLRGRALQAQRQRIWLKHPHCADCGRVVGYPNGFELDHRVGLEHGGTNDDSNMQILCIENGRTQTGCHGKKTRGGR